MKHLSAICLILAVLMLCACAPAVPAQPAETVTPVPTAVPTAAPTVAPTATVEPTAAPTPEAAPILGRREQEKPYWHEIWELLYDQGWLAVPYPNYIYDWEEFMPDARSVFSEMMPYIFVLIRSFPYGPVQKNDFYSNVENDNDVTDAKRVSSVMCGVIQRCGKYHPDAEKGLGSTIILPDSAVKDFMRICFADYTDDMPIPEIEGLTHIDGTYRYNDYNDPNESTNRSRTDYIILDMQHYQKGEYSDENRFYMFIVSLDDADHFQGGKSWKVWLIKNDEPDRLGINWRVEKIVRLPNLTNGIEICDGN